MEKRKKKLYVDNRGRIVDEVVRRSGKKVQKITDIDSDYGQITKSRVVRGKDGKRIKDKYSFRTAEDAPKSEYNRYKSYSGKTKYKKGGSPHEYKSTKERSVDSEGVASVTKKRNTRSGGDVYKYKDSQGNKIRRVRNSEGDIIKTKSRQNVTIFGEGGKPDTTGVERTKSKEAKGGRYKRKTVTMSSDGRKETTKIVAPPEGKSWKRKKVVTISDDGRNVSKKVKDLEGNIKKTVTRTPYNVKKEIKRGGKDVEVYKDEYGKSRTVINFNKNQQYQNDLKGSTFKNFPQQVYDNAMKNKI